MMSELYREHLLNLLKAKGKHDVGYTIDVLPFLSHRTRALKNNFNKVLGEYVRNICEFEIHESKSQEFYMSEEQNEISEHIANRVEFNSDDDKDDFIRFLDKYLFNEEDIKIIHPYLFNFIKIDDNNKYNRKKKNEFGKLGKFINDTLVVNKNDFKLIFDNKGSEDILTELVLSQLDSLKESNEKGQEYQPLLESLTNLYKEDVLFLSKYKDYFLTSFPLLTHFYTFVYVCQLLFKFEQFTDADYNSIQPFYFSLEWESLSKRRKAASDLESFKYIKEKQINLFPHIHTISQLSHNSFNEESFNKKEKIKFLTYTEIYNLVKEGKLDEEQFVKDVTNWINEYSALKSIENESSPGDLNEAFKELFQCLKKGMSTEVSKNYGEKIDDLGANQFIKSRGSLGKVFNIKHELLLLLTAVSVKENRIPLNDLFIEFEKRGIALDRYSKSEVIKLFNNLNIIDKKSDSGDAQYVKPIL